MVILMNKKLIIFLVFVLLVIGIGFFIFIKNKNFSNNVNDYQADKTSTAENSTSKQNDTAESNQTTPNNAESNNAQNNNDDNDTNQVNNNSSSTTPPPQSTPQQPIESTLSTFSTKIYSSDSNRTKNMELTASALNGTTVKNGETFSFCKTVGPASSSKGYLKADIYDNNGNKKKGYGGGNCQISSTLYNAALAVQGITIVERHPHSNKVPYVKKDMDAAVAYGSYDLKFTNNTGNDIKILSSVGSGLVNISINSIKY